MARPSRSRRVRSAVVRADARESTNTSVSAVSGRGFFFGGISPLLTRSCTSTHLAKFVELKRSNFKAVRSSPPFFVSRSWHSRQCFWTKLAEADGRLSAATASPVRNQAPHTSWIFHVIAGLNLTRTVGGKFTVGTWSP